MRIWFGESALKKDFVAYLSDTFDGKPIFVCEIRSLTNAFIRNFTVAHDPSTNKFQKASKVIDQAIKAAVAVLPPELVILDDWINKDALKDVDYYIMHKPEDSDPLFRLSKVDVDMSKAQARAIDQWNTLRLAVPERLLVLEYNERARDVFEILTEEVTGIQIRMTASFPQSHKFVRASMSDSRADAARTLGGVAVNQIPVDKEVPDGEKPN